MASRVASLLPSATETLLALGVVPVARSHSCDFPEVAEVPVVTSTLIDSRRSQAEIDRQVSEQPPDRPLYAVDVELLRSLRPEVTVTQSQCRVCAVGDEDLAEVDLPGTIVSMGASSFAELPADFLALGIAVGAEDAARAIVAEWQRRIEALPEAPAKRPRVAFLEWLDPPFSPGHWVSEMIALAGGEDVLGRPGAAARRLRWDEVEAADADLVIAAPCGYSPAEVAAMAERGMVPTGARFDRPGPGLIAALEWLAALVRRQAAAS